MTPQQQDACKAIAEVAHWTDSSPRLAETAGCSHTTINKLVHEMLDDLGLDVAEPSLCSQGRQGGEKTLLRRLRAGNRRTGAVAVQWYRDRVQAAFRPEYPPYLLDTEWKSKSRTQHHIVSYSDSSLKTNKFAIDHPVFGVGFVIKLIPPGRHSGRAAAEVLFRDKLRTLVAIKE